MEELLKLTSDPFLIEQSTTEAFVGIVANFLEHFESQTDILESFSIINGHPSPNTKTQKLIVGDAVRRASRAPSLTALASEEHARLSQLSGMVNSPQFVSPERTPKHELPAVFPGSSPLLSKDQRKRLGSFDDTTSSSQRAICRAFSLNSFHGNPERVDGFPYLSYSTGQVPELSEELAYFRNLMSCLNEMNVGWQGFRGLMKLDGYPRVIVLRFSHTWERGV